MFNWFNKIKDSVLNMERKRLENYLGQSTDLYDLERRERLLNNSRKNWHI